jgi:hypothetical protein
LGCDFLRCGVRGARHETDYGDGDGDGDGNGCGYGTADVGGQGAIR